jgi:hypothetical protein
LLKANNNCDICSTATEEEACHCCKPHHNRCLHKNPESTWEGTHTIRRPHPAEHVRAPLYVVLSYVVLLAADYAAATAIAATKQHSLPAADTPLSSGTFYSHVSTARAYRKLMDLCTMTMESTVRLTDCSSTRPGAHDLQSMCCCCRPIHPILKVFCSSRVQCIWTHSSAAVQNCLHCSRYRAAQPESAVLGTDCPGWNCVYPGKVASLPGYSSISRVHETSSGSETELLRGDQRCWSFEFGDTGSGHVMTGRTANGTSSRGSNDACWVLCNCFAKPYHHLQLCFRLC